MAVLSQASVHIAAAAAAAAAGADDVMTTVLMCSSGCVQHRPTTNHASLLTLLMFRLKGKGSPYSITERIPVLGSQPAGDVSHKPGDRLPLLSARPAVTPATLKTVATNFATW